MRLRFVGLGILLALPIGPANAGCGDATTQLELNQCAGATLRLADTLLNAAYQQSLGRLGDRPDAVQRLRAAQRAWVDFRDKECAFVGSATEQGSIQPMVVARCRTELTGQRTDRLVGYLRCREGDLGCPMPPAP